MKTFRLILAGALALLALAACKKEEVSDDTNSGTVYDDAWYAADASIGSSSLQFSANDEGGTISFKAEGGSVVVNVDCGTDWTVDNNAADLFGAEVNISAGTLTVTADQNYVEEALTGTLTLLTATDRISFAVITVNQEAYGSPEISVEANEVGFPAVGELAAEVGVESSLGDFDVENTADWLTVEKTDAGVYITASENETLEERTADITVSCTDGHRTGSDIIRVTQDAHAYVTLSSGQLTFASTEGTSSVTVEANYDWAYTLDDEYDWLTVATDGDQITVTVVENPSDADRTATITVSSSDGAANTAEAQLTVSQGAASVPMILTYTVTDAGTSIMLPLYGDVDCTVDWGDGSDIEAVTSVQPTHTYESAGVYDVSVSGTVTALSQRGKYSTSVTGCEKCLTAVKQWGNTGLTDLSYAFYASAYLETLPETTGGGLAKVTSFDDAFYYCKALKSIPEDLFAKSTELTELNMTFYRCEALTEIPEDLFRYNTYLVTIKLPFDLCNSITSVPEGLFQYNVNVTKMCPFYYMEALESVPENIFAKNVKVSDFSEAFYGCTALKEIPGGLFKNNPLAESFKETFRSCSAVESIPVELFKNNPAATDFSSVFYNCKGIKEIPAGLFDYNGEATNFACVFYNCILIESVPEDLFKNNPNVTDANGIFENCSALTSVPGGLFAGFSKCTQCYYLFQNCSSLREIPADLLKGLTAVVQANQLFDGCSALESVPAGLFDDMTLAQTFYCMFKGCKALTTVPEKIFAKNTALNYITGTTPPYGLQGVFYQCTGLETVPEDIFPSISTEINTTQIFYGCTSLKSVPEKIFAGLTGATSFSNAFYNCTSLTSLPAGLFDNNTKVVDFQQTFRDCTSLTGESPYTMVNGVKVHLYERADYPDSFDAPTTTTNCFYNCTNLDDYSSIPSTWGGGI